MATHTHTEEKDWLTITKSDLIERLTNKHPQIPAKLVEAGVKKIIDIMGQTLAHGERIEIRGFGSFTLHFRKEREGRNPKTGEKVVLDSKYVPHFKPGKELRERVNAQDQKR